MPDQWEEAAKAFKPAAANGTAAPPANEDWKLWSAKSPDEKPGFMSSLGETLKKGPGNLLAAGNAINGMVTTNPMKPGGIWHTLSGMGQQTVDMGSDAAQSFKKGDAIGGIRKGINTGINAVVPGLGAQSEDAGQEFDKGNTAAGFGKTVGLGANTVMGVASPKIAGMGAKAVYNTPRALSAVGTGLKAAAPDLAIGGAKVGAGIAASEMLPGGPIKYAAGAYPAYSGARQIARGLEQGAGATRAAFNGTEYPPPPMASRPASGLPESAPPPGEPGVRYVQHLGDMRINGRTPVPPKLFDPFGREIR